EKKEITTPSREEDSVLDFKSKAPEPTPIPTPGDAKSTSAGGSGGESGSGSSGDGGNKKRKTSSERGLQKPSVPDIYPQVMAIPITRRPLFPGFYKAITIRDPDVVSAIQEMMKRGQPYVGAFLLKDENADKDTIDSPDEVYDIGTFCQVTSAFPVHGEERSLTAVLYPHRRIKMSSLIPPNRVSKDTSTQTESAPAAVATATIEVDPSTESATKRAIESATEPAKEPVVEPTADPVKSSETAEKHGDVV
ncbi:ATP-dependent Lon protease pim1, partial [Cryomyces antarcticus]